MTGKKPEKPPVILLIVSTSFGEVDWILPVLVAFKETHPDWQLISLFSHPQLWQNLQQNPILFAEFTKISGLNILPHEIDTLFASKIEPEQVKIILKDYNKDEYAPCKSYLADKCPQALLVNFPHSRHIYSNRDLDAIGNPVEPEDWSRHDLFLLDSENDIPYWSNHVLLEKIRTFGYPVYDSWWIKRLLAAPEFLQSPEARRAKAAGEVFFYISRGEHSHYLSQEDYEYLLRSLCEEVFARENAFLLIKAHPRQDLQELERLLAPYDRGRWLISGLHLLQLASLADVVISGWSSGILDALAVGKPVIEFWRFGGKDPLCRKTSEGQFTTIYRELGLAAPANNREELRELLDSALQGSESEVWQGQQAAFLRHCKESDTASQAVANALFEEAKIREAALMQRKETTSNAALITAMLDYMTGLAEQGEDARVGQWLDFLRHQFPEDLQVQNNLGVFLFNRGEFTAAVEQLIQCYQAEPTSRETAVNLAHILLLLERTQEASNVVVDFCRNAAGSGPRIAFLQALREQVEPAYFRQIQESITFSRGKR